MASYTIPQGTTEALKFQLEADGAAIDGSGLTPTLEIETRKGASVTLGGTVAWHTQASGIVKYTPVAGDYTSALVPADSPYQVRWKLTASGVIYYVPNGDEPDYWTIVDVP